MVPIAHVSFVKFARGALGGRLGSPCRMVPARPVLETMYNSHGWSSLYGFTLFRYAFQLPNSEILTASWTATSSQRKPLTTRPSLR